MLKNYLLNLREKKPLVYNVTNTVTINDCANCLLAIGASAVMSSEASEAKDLIKMASCVNINIGTVNKKSYKLMKAASILSSKYLKPSVLDIVGLGASHFRGKVVNRLLHSTKFTVIKGNISEFKALIYGKDKYFLENSCGVDVRKKDEIKAAHDLTKPEVQEFLFETKKLSKKIDSTFVLTGAIDLIINKKNVIIVENGHELMSRVCGTGCMLSAVLAAFLGANISTNRKLDEIEKVCTAAVCAFGICGEMATDAIKKTDGTISYKTKLIDQLYVLKAEDLEKRAKQKSL